MQTLHALLCSPNSKPFLQEKHLACAEIMALSLFRSDVLEAAIITDILPKLSCIRVKIYYSYTIILFKIQSSEVFAKRLRKTLETT